MNNEIRLSHLQYSFPKLTEASQFYVLGLMDGLKHAQGKGEGKNEQKKITMLREQNSKIN